MAIDFVDNGSDDGANLGRSSGKVGFYETTPVVQPAPAVAVGTDLATVILELADLRAQLVALGLIVS